MKIVLQFIFILFVSTYSYGQIGRLKLSPRQHIEQLIGLTTIAIDYSRPSMRGRAVFGELVPFDTYWRTGANQNTTISFDQDVFIDNQRIKKGKYSIITKPGKENWEFILYNETDNWDVPDEIETSKIVAKTTVTPSTFADSKEVMLIEIGDFTNYAFDLNIYWENTKLRIPIKLNTRDLMDKKIENQLNGPQYDDYYLAAVYQLESGGEYEKGLEWINKAMEVAGEKGWWNLRVKTKLLLKLDQKEEAKVAAQQGLISAKEEKRETIIEEFEHILDSLK